MKKFLLLLPLAACQATTPEGCPVYMTEMMQAQTQACIAAYNEEKARQAGGTVTKCTPVGGSMSCATY